MPKFRPLESFPMKMMKVLIGASVAPVEIFASEDGRPPKMVTAWPTNAGECEVKTRWHFVVFETAEAAKRFKALIHLAHELHELRRSMKHFGHPSARDVYRVRVSVDDRRGSLRIRSHDAVLEELLGPTWEGRASPAAASPPGGGSTPASVDVMDGFVDPLEEMGAGEWFMREESE